MTVEIELDDDAKLAWPCFRLADAAWCGLADALTLTTEEVDLANLTLDAIARARHEADKDR